MKYFFLFMPFLFSCSFYLDTKEVTVSGLNKGRLLITSKSSVEEFNIDESRSITICLNKGEIYYISFYADFYGRENRFPYGGVITLEKDYITLSPHLGLLTSVCNSLNYSGVEIDLDNLLELIDLLTSANDPWIYIKDDIRHFLIGDITLGSISKFKTLSIPELDEYYSYIPENHLLNSWYPSVQSFYLTTSNNFYRLHIYEDSTFSGFVEFK